MHKYMTVKMPDGSMWGVPVEMIARNRAEHYASEFDGDVERSLAEDTIPMLEADDYEIHDWAANNMNWSDFDGHQVKLADAPAPDFQDAWMRGDQGFWDDDVATRDDTVPGHLRRLADQMDLVALLMVEKAPPAERGVYARHAAEMAGAADVAREWANEIEQDGA